MGFSVGHRSWAWFVVLVAAALLAAVVAGARPVAATHDDGGFVPPLGLATDTFFDESFPSVFVDSQGRVQVVYVEEDLTTGATNLTLATLTGIRPYGAPRLVRPVSPTTLVNDVPGTVFAGTWAAVSEGPDASLFVAFADARDAATRGLDIYVARSVDGGLSFLPAVRVSDADGIGDELYPRIAVDDVGVIYVAWTDTRSGTNFDIFFATSTDGGKSFGPNVKVSDQPGGWHAIFADLAVDAEGTVHLVFDALSPSQTTWTANYTRSFNGGASFQPSRELSRLSFFSLFPRVVVDGRGTVHVAWIDLRVVEGRSSAIVYRQSTDGGNTFGDEIFVNDGGAGPVVDLVFDLVVSEDMVVVAYTTSPRGVDLGVAYSFSTDGGIHFTGDRPATSFDPIPFGNTTLFVDTMFPSLDVDGDGTFFLLYNLFLANETVRSDFDVAISWFDAPPSPPTNVTVEASGSGTLVVSWNASPEADVRSYNVYVSQDGSRYDFVASVPQTATSYAQDGLANGTYWYRVTAVDEFGHESHPTAGMAGTVGPTAEDRFRDLEQQLEERGDELAALEGRLGGLESRLEQLREELGLAQDELARKQDALASSTFLNTVLIGAVIALAAYPVATSLWRRLKRRVPPPPPPA
jgi:hypothetical protein